MGEDNVVSLLEPRSTWHRQILRPRQKSPIQLQLWPTSTPLRLPIRLQPLRRTSTKLKFPLKARGRNCLRRWKHVNQHATFAWAATTTPLRAPAAATMDRSSSRTRTTTSLLESVQVQLVSFARSWWPSSLSFPCCLVPALTSPTLPTRHSLKMRSQWPASWASCYTWHAAQRPQW